MKTQKILSSKITFANKIILGVSVLGLLLLTMSTRSPATSLVTDKPLDSKAIKIDELMNKYAKYGQFNGSILVAQHGKIVYKKGFGMANMEWNIPNQTDTKFRLASISKQFTALLIMQLVAEKKLDLEQPISNYLPNYPKKTGDKITLHHLLTHTSGIPNYTSFPTYRDNMGKYASPEELVAHFADSSLDFIPGEKFSYSNSGYALLGYIIEKTTGKTYETVLQEKIFTPLNMTNSGYENNYTLLQNRAAGYFKEGLTYVNAGFIDMSRAYSAGGLYSTVEDMFLWDQALRNENLLPKKYLDILFEGHISAWDGFYGYGWERQKLRIGNTEERLDAILHSGSINGFNSLITRVNDDSTVIVLLVNVMHAPLNHITKGINGILRNKPYDMPVQSIADVLLASIEKDGIVLAMAYYEKIKDSKAYYFDENEINAAGYSLLRSGKAYEASEVFQLNIQKFSGSYNAYDSYAEALMTLGKKKAAIKNYEKSLELFAGNSNAVAMLRKLGVEWKE